jgi:hypothetical protein
MNGLELALRIVGGVLAFLACQPSLTPEEAIGGTLCSAIVGAPAGDVSKARTPPTRDDEATPGDGEEQSSSHQDPADEPHVTHGRSREASSSSSPQPLAQ